MIEIQLACEDITIPPKKLLSAWANLVVGQNNAITIRIVDKEEIAELNNLYRKVNKPTNVLSFPFELPDEIPQDALESNYLGDIAICAEVVKKEAKEQGKSCLSHWAHMIIHGCLHLLGYDHIVPPDATAMEEKEIDLLKQLGFSNPYEI